MFIKTCKKQKAVETSRGMTGYTDNLKNCNSINQIFENMETAYLHHAERTGKELSKGWDMVNLAKLIPPNGAKGIGSPEDDDPDYHPTPIGHLNPKTMEFKQIEKYMSMFEKEVGELLKICEKGSAKEYTRAKMARREELENKLAEFEIEKDFRLENRGGSKRTEDPGEVEDPEDQEEPKSFFD